MVKLLTRGYRPWPGAAAVSRGLAAAAPGPHDRRWRVDAGIAAVVTGVSVAGSLAASRHPHAPPVNLAGFLLVALGGIALVARRRYPGTALGATLVLALLAGSLGHAHAGWLAVIIAFFAAVRARRRAAVIGSLVTGYLASVWPPWLIGSPGHTTVTFALDLLCGLLVLLSTAELVRAATERRLAAQRIREQERRQLASEERMRIARDLHDVVAHNISVINVQANTALHLARRRPEVALQALATINDVSRQALVELRSVLGVLRADGDTAPREPAPGLADLGTLVGNMAAAGLRVELETEGSPAPLPASVDVAAYRIIQEALTNSARHSGAARSIVRVRYRRREVEIEVEDEGTTTGPKPARPVGTGSGIAGMTDRAQALGGWLRAGPQPGAGFLVTAVLPATGSER
jgi:signal transduction histidine kinase